MATFGRFNENLVNIAQNDGFESCLFSGCSSGLAGGIFEVIHKGPDNIKNYFLILLLEADE